jgi:hypothetical protein
MYMLVGYSKVVSFDNGYAASIVSSDMSYGGKDGLFEIAILHNRDIVYDTGITEDVIGFLDFQGVVDTLKKIEQLPQRKPL